MRFLDLYIKGFGKFHDTFLSFEDGLKTGEYREITRGEWKELTELLEGKGERRKADQKNAEKHSELGQREPEKGGR